MKAITAIKTLGVLVVLCLGIWWGGHPGELPGFLRSAFVANPHDAVISEVLSDIQHDYYHPVSRSQLVDNSIAGAVASLNDPYARYETPKVYEAFSHPSPDRFSGIGVIVIPTAAGLVVKAVYPGEPAARGGLRDGDLITAVDGQPLARAKGTASTALIHGRAGTSVRLGISRANRRFAVTLTRELISTPGVIPSVVSDHGVKVGVIPLSTFDVEGIHGEVAQALEALLGQHVKGIVLDLRDNGGGLVTEAQLVASLFLSHGVIVTTRGRTQPTQTIDAVGHAIAPTIPLAVLVNADTASAAEIVSGALQDHHRALLVGTRTYGKGVFQDILPLSNGGALDITVGQYFLPNGRNLGAGGLRRGAGIQPDVIVKAAPSATGDPQLAAAVRILAAKAR